MGSTFHLGVDLGQRRDHTAIAIVERRETEIRGFDYVNWRGTAEREPETWIVRRLERVALGTPYTAVAERLAALDKNPKLEGRNTFVVDATGVGAPVVDMLRERGLGARLIPVILTGAQAPHYDGHSWRVPKVDLLARLQMLFESGRLRISRRAAYAPQLIRELVDVRARTRAWGRVSVGADGHGQHDDLVIAVALAVWPAAGRGAEGDDRVGWVQRRLL